MTKEIMDAIASRRTVRRFAKDEVPRDTISRVVTAGTQAPSAGNIQPWHFYVVFNAEGRKALAEACNGQQYVSDAPVCVVVCAEPALSEDQFGPRGRRLYCIQDTAAAVENMLLACSAYGLGTCWTGDFDEEAVRAVVGADESRLPVAILPIGYPDGESSPDRMRPFGEVVTNIV